MTIGGTGHTCSAAIASGAREVARMRTSGAAASRSLTSGPHSSSRCSQPSSRSSSRLSASCSARAFLGDAAVGSSIPRLVSSTRASSSRGRTLASSTSQTPSGKTRRRSRATRVANRDLPTPATPVRVTSREAASIRLICVIAPRRPTKLVRSSGSLPTRRVVIARPPALTDHLVVPECMPALARSSMSAHAAGRPTVLPPGRTSLTCRAVSDRTPTAVRPRAPRRTHRR